MSAAHGSVLILIVAMVLYVTEAVPIAVTALGSCVALAVLNIVPAATVWVGLSNDTTLVVAGMVAACMAVIDTGAAKSVGNFFVKRFHSNVEAAGMAVVFVALTFSGFMNNSAAVATMLPVMGGVVVASKGRMHEKYWFMPLAVATNAGGMLTLIGTTSQMVVQNELIKNDMRPFGFFEFGWVGVPMCLLFVLYFLLLKDKLGKMIWGEPVGHTEMIERLIKSETLETQREITPKVKKKQILSVAIMVGAIVWMTSPSSATNGTVAMAAAGLVVITGCISLKNMLRDFDWTTIFVLAGGIGFANGLDKSGGGKLIADWIAGLFGSSLSPMQVFVMFTITSAILTLFMSNTAVTAMLTPVAFAFTNIVDFNIIPVLMGICMGSNCAFSTPIATPSMTLVVGPGEYRFMDYVKWCLPYNILAVILLLLVIPMVWKL